MATLRLSHRLVHLLICVFHTAGIQLTFAIDKVLVRRWERRIRLRGNYRYLLASSKDRSASAPGACVRSPPPPPRPAETVGLPCKAGDRRPNLTAFVDDPTMTGWHGHVFVAMSGRETRPSMPTRTWAWHPAFDLAFARGPDAIERAGAVELINRHGLDAFCRALFNANELISLD